MLERDVFVDESLMPYKGRFILETTYSNQITCDLVSNFLCFVRLKQSAFVISLSIQYKFSTVFNCIQIVVSWL